MVEAQYRLTIDGQVVEARGTKCYIVNSGMTGKGLSVDKDFSATDGLLDVFLLNKDLAHFRAAAARFLHVNRPTARGSNAGKARRSQSRLIPTGPFGLMASTSAGRRSRPLFCLEHWQSSCHDLLWGAQAGPASAIRRTYRKVAGTESQRAGRSASAIPDSPLKYRCSWKHA